MAIHYLKSRKNLSDLLSTAFSGSSWFAVCTPKKYRNKYSDFEYCEDKWAQILIDGGYINVIDDEGEVTYKLTLEMLYNAWISDDPQVARAKANVLEENADLYDADAIVQYALFGKVMFG